VHKIHWLTGETTFVLTSGGHNAGIVSNRAIRTAISMC
jgi:hypothetical protein